MTGQNALRGVIFGALLSLSAGSVAQQIVTTSDVIQQPGYQTSWQNMVKGQARLPGWARKGVGTSTPAQSLSWKGQNYLVGNLCKPHDCANNFLIVAFKEDKSQAWAYASRSPTNRKRLIIRSSTPNTNGWASRTKT